MIFLAFFLALITISSYAADESCSVNTADREKEDAEKCLIMLKPDTVNRGLVGELIQRFEKKGFTLLEMKMVQAERSVLEEHYQEHTGKSFFPGLLDYMVSGPVVPMVWRGKNIITISRRMLGATDPLESLPGTIRGDLGVSKQMNLCHVSDSLDSAEREIKLWFPESNSSKRIDPLSAWKA
ncbi:nucleoside diphosphate kinase 1-like isoform X1 [Eurytemora carolleeae]|uniref:nucleoside diphosphate kinase 1-like isoform X1 n=1 Tax=Eurytemora carolleeae TaxID=1294199 RepID=UPI000C77ACAC|nr:nucleoside diphosphate kinase 1-like isoform X1 [Eurytemora carolleeae]|eukprot:XP_023345497.1 nucleoside diphosphate kinase 1-like isoform X1 [Eurytemora affinis]